MCEQALAQNRATFASGGSQVWFFKPVETTETIGQAPSPSERSSVGNHDSGDPAAVAAAGGEATGWFGSMLQSLVGADAPSDSFIGSSSVADAALTRLYLQGHPLHDSLLRNAASLQTAAFGICDAALLADADGMHHALPAVQATNELQRSLMQVCFYLLSWFSFHSS